VCAFVGFCVGSGVSVGFCVGNGVSVGVAVDDAVDVAVGGTVDVWVGVSVGVGVLVGVIVAVLVRVGVGAEVLVGVPVGVCAVVCTTVGVSVGVGVGGAAGSTGVSVGSIVEVPVGSGIDVLGAGTAVLVGDLGIGAAVDETSIDGGVTVCIPTTIMGGPSPPRAIKAAMMAKVPLMTAPIIAARIVTPILSHHLFSFLVGSPALLLNFRLYLSRVQPHPLPSDRLLIISSSRYRFGWLWLQLNKRDRCDYVSTDA
jgi:hypothetical protein